MNTQKVIKLFSDTLFENTEESNFFSSADMVFSFIDSSEIANVPELVPYLQKKKLDELFIMSSQPDTLAYDVFTEFFVRKLSLLSFEEKSALVADFLERNKEDILYYVVQKEIQVALALSEKKKDYKDLVKDLKILAFQYEKDVNLSHNKTLIKNIVNKYMNSEKNIHNLIFGNIMEDEKFQSLLE